MFPNRKRKAIPTNQQAASNTRKSALLAPKSQSMSVSAAGLPMASTSTSQPEKGSLLHRKQVH